MSKNDSEKKTALEKLFRKKEKKHPPTSGEIKSSKSTERQCYEYMKIST